MGLFWPSKHGISKKKFEEKVRKHLYNRGFSHRELDEIEEIFRGDIESKNPGYDTPCLTKEEAAAGIAWMRKNVDIHKIPKKKIDELEETIKKNF